MFKLDNKMTLLYKSIFGYKKIILGKTYEITLLSDNGTVENIKEKIISYNVIKHELIVKKYNRESKTIEFQNVLNIRLYSKEFDDFISTLIGIGVVGGIIVGGISLLGFINNLLK